MRDKHSKTDQFLDADQIEKAAECYLSKFLKSVQGDLPHLLAAIAKGHGRGRFSEVQAANASLFLETADEINTLLHIRSRGVSLDSAHAVERHQNTLIAAWEQAFKLALMGGVMSKITLDVLREIERRRQKEQVQH